MLILRHGVRSTVGPNSCQSGGRLICNMFAVFRRRFPRFIPMLMLVVFLAFYVLSADRENLGSQNIRDVHLVNKGNKSTYYRREAHRNTERNLTHTKDEEDNVIMENCPEGWPLESGADTTLQTSWQVCREASGTRQWICAPGWKKLESEPFCRKRRIGVKCTAISDRHMLLFIDIPHTGGAKIGRSELLFNGGSQSKHCPRESEFHGIREYDTEEAKDYHKFAMVRHPCARLISIWKDLARKTKNSSDLIEVNSERTWAHSFISFVERVYLSGIEDTPLEDREMLRPQVTMIFDREGQFGLDRIIPHERLAQGIRELGRRTKIDPGGLLAELQPAVDEEGACDYMYNEESWMRMRRLYAMDICVLGYSSDINEANKLPSENATVEALTSRYQKCKEMIT